MSNLRIPMPDGRAPQMANDRKTLSKILDGAITSVASSRMIVRGLPVPQTSNSYLTAELSNYPVISALLINPLQVNKLSLFITQVTCLVRSTAPFTEIVIGPVFTATRDSRRTSLRECTTLAGECTLYSRRSNARQGSGSERLNFGRPADLGGFVTRYSDNPTGPQTMIMICDVTPFSFNLQVWIWRQWGQRSS